MKEEPTWLDGGRCGGCSGGSGPSQLEPGTKRSRAGRWTLDGRQQVLVLIFFGDLFLVLTHGTIFLGVVDF